MQNSHTFTCDCDVLLIKSGLVGVEQFPDYWPITVRLNLAVTEIFRNFQMYDKVESKGVPKNPGNPPFSLPIGRLDYLPDTPTCLGLSKKRYSSTLVCRWGFIIFGKCLVNYCYINHILGDRTVATNRKQVDQVKSMG